MNGTQFASISGSYTTSYIGSWELLSQSIQGNYSVIRLYGTFRYSGGSSVGSSSSTFSVNGATVKTGSYRFYPGDTQLGYTDITVYHNADGTFPAQTVSIYADSYHISNKSASGTIAGVATIPRASSVGISSSQITMGDTLSIYVGRASDSFYHTLTYSFGGASGTIATGVGTGASWTVPIDLAYKIPNSVSGVGTIYCYTYSGGTHIGTSSINFTAVVPQSIAPSLQSLTLERVDNTVPTDWNVYVKTKSSCTATINGATGSYGSTISAYSISGGGYSSSANTLTTGVINIAGTVTFTARITDSRGRTATQQQSITLVDYNGPNIQQVLTQRCLQDGTLDNDGTYAKCKATISYSDCNGKNALMQKVYFKKSGTEQWSTGTQFTNEVIIGGGNISIDYSYDVKYEVSDTFTTVVFIDFISTAFTTMDYKKGGKGIAFGKMSEKDCFECAMGAKFTKKVSIYDDLTITGSLTVNGGTNKSTMTIIIPGADLPLTSAGIGVNKTEKVSTAGAVTSKGTKFTKSTDAGIVIGKGISHILVSGYMQFSYISGSGPQYCRASVFRYRPSLNQYTYIIGGSQKGLLSWEGLNTCPSLVDVQEGDIIYLFVGCNVPATLQTNAGMLTVEEI